MQLRKQAAERFGGNAEQMPEFPAELFEEQAKERVKVGLLLGEVIRSNELKARRRKSRRNYCYCGVCV